MPADRAAAMVARRHHHSRASCRPQSSSCCCVIPLVRELLALALSTSQLTIGPPTKNGERTRRRQVQHAHRVTASDGNCARLISITPRGSSRRTSTSPHCSFASMIPRYLAHERGLGSFELLSPRCRRAAFVCVPVDARVPQPLRIAVRVPSTKVYLPAGAPLGRPACGRGAIKKKKKLRSLPFAPPAPPRIHLPFLRAASCGRCSTW